MARDQQMPYEARTRLLEELWDVAQKTTEMTGLDTSRWDMGNGPA
jgi:hypothetical protein